MITQNPSIFNNILGPVMRGPSSSHTAASWRIAKVSLDILNNELSEALVEFDEKGAWASNYEPQGTVLGMSGGLLNIDLKEEKILDYKNIANNRNVNIEYKISSFPTDHPNTVRLTLKSKRGKKIQVTAVSTGGGMMEVKRVNDIPVSIRGDYHELLIFYNNPLDDKEKQKIRDLLTENGFIHWEKNDDFQVLQIKSTQPFAKGLQDQIGKIKKPIHFAQINPVLPILSGNEQEIPFVSVPSMLDFGNKHHLDMGKLGMVYEQAKSGLEHSQLEKMMEDLIHIVEHSMTKGLEGTQYEDRILPHQSHYLYFRNKNQEYFDPLVNLIISYVSAIMEYKSSFGVIVAIPTAGSCGTVGGLLKAVGEKLRSSLEDIIKAYFAAGMIGVFIANGPGFSAEEHGCQVETGAAGAMAAGALVQLYGGNARQAINAASMTLQNCIGLVCDPVANRVEVPCLGKNVAAAMNALSSATMALSGYDPVIPFEETIESVKNVGKKMHSDFCCTGRGGLAITPTSRNLLRKLKKTNDTKNRH
ncbi:MAG: L-serine ammonia-lyase, iron-sulfur-dependent, subunit alpha [Bacteroidales bacterium]|nr:L-serine ammonia-lyase, iron-sulfur-dependent, subunit alpha [Bacteroidales bacterium]